MKIKRSFNDVTIIKDGQVGEGSRLVFPNMSSCTAVVANLKDTLVGAHFTQDVWRDHDPATYTRGLLTRLIDTIDGREIYRLQIVGFNQEHNPPKIAAALNVEPSQREAYDVSLRGLVELTLMFTFLSYQDWPKVNYLKQSRVVSLLAHPVLGDVDYHYGQRGNMQTKFRPLKTIARQHFVQLSL